MKKTIFYLGPMDKTLGSLKMCKQDQQITFSMEGILSLESLFQQDESIADNSYVLVNGFHKKISFEGKNKLNLFNLVCSAEGSTSSIKMCKRLTQSPYIDRIFNHPDQILRTARKNAYSYYHDISGIFVPQIFQITDSFIHDTEELVENEKIQFPFIARIEGFHDGKSMHLIENYDDIIELDKYDETIFNLLLIEYREAKTQQNLFHKIRIAFINGDYYPRHCLQSDQWCVHAKTRNSFMLDHTNSRKFEENFLENFYDSLSASQDKTLRELNKRIGLDVWGLDCALLPDGKFLFYEANACMNLLPLNNRPEFSYINQHTDKIKRAIKNMILQS